MKRVSMLELRRRARAMRKEMTEAEGLLWQLLRSSPVGFRSQHILFPFIVDFYAAHVQLAIEVDGDAHTGAEDYDARRDMYLWRRYGVDVVRFPNDAVLTRPELVLKRIESMCRALEGGA